MSRRTAVVSMLLAAALGCYAQEGERVDLRLDDPMGIAIVQRLVKAFEGEAVECPPFFHFSSERTDGYACVRASRELTTADVMAAIMPVVEDFDGWFQVVPGWVADPGRIAAEFGHFRGSSIADSHAIEIGLIGREIVVKDQAWSGGKKD